MCAYIMSMTTIPDVDDRRARTNVCEAIGRMAHEVGEDPAILISLSWHESRFSVAGHSTKGARGPLQVIPGYWCPNKAAQGCDFTRAGIRAYTAYRKKHKDLRETICHYNSGNVCYRRSYLYADRVLVKAAMLRRHARATLPSDYPVN